MAEGEVSPHSRSAKPAMPPARRSPPTSRAAWSAASFRRLGGHAGPAARRRRAERHRPGPMRLYRASVHPSLGKLSSPRPAHAEKLSGLRIQGARRCATARMLRFTSPRLRGEVGAYRAKARYATGEGAAALPKLVPELHSGVVGAAAQSVVRDRSWWHLRRAWKVPLTRTPRSARNSTSPRERLSYSHISVCGGTTGLIP